MLPVLMICFLLFEFILGSAHAGNSAKSVYTSTCSKLMNENPATFELTKIANFPLDVVAKSLHDALYAQFIHDGADEAEQVADDNEKITENDFKDITPSKFSDVLCEVNKIILAKRGVLTKENAHLLAEQSVQDMADAASLFDTTTALGIWKTVIHGYEHFYARYGITEDDIAYDLSKAYAKALKNE